MHQHQTDRSSVGAFIQSIHDSLLNLRPSLLSPEHASRNANVVTHNLAKMGSMFSAH